MSRIAFLFSILLHAGVLVAVGLWWLPGAAMHDDPGLPGVAVTLLAMESGTPAAAEEPAPEPPASDPVAIEPAPPPPVENLLPIPTPAVAEQIVARVEAAPEAPIVKPKSTPAKPVRAAVRLPANPGKINRQVASQVTGGTGAGGGGSGGGDNAGAGFIPPRFRIRYKPPYPEGARAQRLEGTVLLTVSVDARGRVSSLELSRSCGHAMLDRAAMESVRSWIFEPAHSNGIAVAAQVEIPVRFEFEERRVKRA